MDYKKLYEQTLAENKKLKEENEKLKQYKEYYDKWSPILSDIDGDQFCDLLSDYGWKYNDEGELVGLMKKTDCDFSGWNNNDGQTIQDINGKNYQMPTQEQADHFGISLEEMIGLMKTTDCDFSD